MATMSREIAERRARSTRNAGLLLVVWGTSMLLLELLVLGDTLPLRERVLRDPLFLPGCVTLLIVGLAVGGTAQSALGGSGRTSRMLTLLRPVGITYGVIVCGVYVMATSRTSTLTHTLAAAIAAAAVFGIWCIVLTRAARTAHSLASELERSDPREP